MQPAFTSGDLARATGHTVRAVRHYEEEGLLAPTQVSDGGRRRYTTADLERLRLIVDLRELGLGISEIKSILELQGRCQTAGEFASELRGVLEGHLAQAQRRLERLRRMRREIVASLELVEERMKAQSAAGCPCQVAADAAAPRIVKVLLGHRGCGCAEAAGAGHLDDGHHDLGAGGCHPQGDGSHHAAVQGEGMPRSATWPDADDVPSGHA